MKNNLTHRHEIDAKRQQNEGHSSTAGKLWRNFVIDIPRPKKMTENITGLLKKTQDSDTWYFSGAPVKNKQGWKIYISATLLTFVDTLNVVVPVFEDNNISYKYVASDKVLRKLNAGLLGYSQVGKLIVGYLDSNTQPEKFSRLIRALTIALEPFRHTHPAVPFAKPLGGGFPLYYRYGAYEGDTLKINGKEIEDNRSDPNQAIPEGTIDIFSDFLHPIISEKPINNFLTRFPIFEALAQGGKGGVFGAFDIDQDDFTDVIIKIGYKNGQVLPDGRDGYSLLHREYNFFQRLKQQKLDALAPKFIAYEKFIHKNALVMARIQGKNLMNVRIDGELNIDHLTQAQHIISTLHSNGLFLGDAKLANFVLDENDKVWVIDFECAGDLEHEKQDFLTTFHFYNPNITPAQTRDHIHFLYSVMYNEAANYSFSETDRLIDIKDLQSNYEPKSDVETWAFSQFSKFLM